MVGKGSLSLMAHPERRELVDFSRCARGPIRKRLAESQGALSGDLPIGHGGDGPGESRRCHAGRRALTIHTLDIA